MRGGRSTSGRWRGKGREGKGRGGGREVVAIPNANANLGLAGGGQSPFVQVIPSAECSAECRVQVQDGKGRERDGKSSCGEMAETSLGTSFWLTQPHRPHTALVDMLFPAMDWTSTPQPF